MFIRFISSTFYNLIFKQGLFVVCFTLWVYQRFARSEDSMKNILNGAIGVLFVFFGTIIVQDPFRSKLFVRPFPWMWRVVAGSAFLMLLLLTFVMFQTPNDIIKAIHYLFPTLKLVQYPEIEIAKVPGKHNSFVNFLIKVWEFIKEKNMIEKFGNWFLRSFVYRDWTMLWYDLVI